MATQGMPPFQGYRLRQDSHTDDVVLNDLNAQSSLHLLHESDDNEDDNEEDDKSSVHSFELYTPDEEKSLLRKLDTRLVLFLALLYMLSFLDRSSTKSIAQLLVIKY